MDNDFATIHSSLEVFGRRVKSANRDMRGEIFSKLLDELKKVSSQIDGETDVIWLGDKIKIMLRKHNLDIGAKNNSNETLIHILADGTNADGLYHALGKESPRDWIRYFLNSTVHSKVLLVRSTFWERDNNLKNCYEIALATNNEPVANLILDHEEEIASTPNPRTHDYPLSLVVEGNKHPNMVKKLMDAYPEALLEKNYEGEPLYAALCLKYTGYTRNDREEVIDHQTAKLMYLGKNRDE